MLYEEINLENYSLEDFRNVIKQYAKDVDELEIVKDLHKLEVFTNEFESIGNPITFELNFEDHHIIPFLYECIHLKAINENNKNIKLIFTPRQFY